MVSSRDPLSPLPAPAPTSLNPPFPSLPPNPEEPPPKPLPGLYCCWAKAAEITSDRAEGRILNIGHWSRSFQSYLKPEQISSLLSCNGFTAMKDWRWTDPFLRWTNLYSWMYDTPWPYWAVLPFLVTEHQIYPGRLFLIVDLQPSTSAACLSHSLKRQIFLTSLTPLIMKVLYLFSNYQMNNWLNSSGFILVICSDLYR